MRTRRSTVAPAPAPEPSVVRAWLGSWKTPTVVPDDAEAMLAQLPWPAVSVALAALERWAAGAPVTGIRACVVTEPEDPDWREVVFAARVDASTQEALELWENLAAALDQALASLSVAHRDLLSKHFDVHVLWDDDPWYDGHDPAF